MPSAVDPNFCISTARLFRGEKQMAPIVPDDPYAQFRKSLLTTPGYLNLAIRFVRLHFSSILSMSLVMTGSFHFLAYELQIPKPKTLQDPVHPILILMLLTKLLYFVWLTLLVDMDFKRASIPLKTVIHYSVRRLPHAILVAILSAVICIAGVFLFIFPGILAIFFLQFAITAASIRGLTSMSALRYSIYIVKSAWQHILPLFFIFNFLIPQLLMLPVASLLPFIGLPQAESDFLTAIVSDIVVIPSSVLWIMLFLNVEARAPQFDE